MNVGQAGVELLEPFKLTARTKQPVRVCKEPHTTHGSEQIVTDHCNEDQRQHCMNAKSIRLAQVTAPHMQRYVGNVTPAQTGSERSYVPSKQWPQLLSRAASLTIVFSSFVAWRQDKRESEERAAYRSGTHTLAPNPSTVHVRLFSPAAAR